jgi:hypothetical protein
MPRACWAECIRLPPFAGSWRAHEMVSTLCRRRLQPRERSRRSRRFAGVGRKRASARDGLEALRASAASAQARAGAQVGIHGRRRLERAQQSQVVCADRRTATNWLCCEARKASNDPRVRARWLRLTPAKRQCFFVRPTPVLPRIAGLVARGARHMPDGVDALRALVVAARAHGMVLCGRWVPDTVLTPCARALETPVWPMWCAPTYGCVLKKAIHADAWECLCMPQD